MALQLLPMDEQDYESYARQTIEDFAQHLILIRSLSFLEAQNEAEKSLKKSLPDGFQTGNTHFLKIMKDDEHIGFMRFEIREVGTLKLAFGWDFKIFEAFRGHGFSAMVAAKNHLKELGCSKFALHTFAKNERAVNLYKAVGFSVDSYNMSMDL